MTSRNDTVGHAPASDAAAKRCLVVDDSATIRRVMSAMLREFGYVISEAPTGLQAVEQCKTDPPGLIFLDWNMPVMDGITCLRALRAMPMEPRPTIVLCTTENSLSKIHEALSAGADEYIMKPFDREILHDKLVQLGLRTADEL